MTAAAGRLDVAISGASFAGLALARGLTQALGPGVRIAMIDRAASFNGPGGNDGRAFAIWAGSKAVLDTLGVWADVAPAAEAMGRPLKFWIWRSMTGCARTRLTYDAQTADGRLVAYMAQPAGGQASGPVRVDRERAEYTWVAC